MKWIVLAIVVVIVPYTFLTLRYRKPGPAFQPYEDMKNRANVSRLLSAGYQRIPLTALQPTEPLRPAEPALVRRAPGGLPPDLKSTLVDAPSLPLEIVGVSVAAVANTLQSYRIQFTCRIAGDQQQPAGADLYVKEGAVIITPTLEGIGGELQSRTREPVVLLHVPPGALKPGDYRVILAGEQASCTWTLRVN